MKEGILGLYLDTFVMPGDDDEVKRVLFCWIPTSILSKRAGHWVKQGRGLWAHWAVTHRKQRAANTDVSHCKPAGRSSGFGIKHISVICREQQLFSNACNNAALAWQQPPQYNHPEPRCSQMADQHSDISFLYNISIINQQQVWDLCPHKLLLQLRRIILPSIVSALQCRPLTPDLLVSVDLKIEALCCFYLKFRLQIKLVACFCQTHLSPLLAGHTGHTGHTGTPSHTHTNLSL